MLFRNFLAVPFVFVVDIRRLSHNVSRISGGHLDTFIIAMKNLLIFTELGNGKVMFPAIFFSKCCAFVKSIVLIGAWRSLMSKFDSVSQKSRSVPSFTPNQTIVEYRLSKSKQSPLSLSIILFSRQRSCYTQHNYINSFTENY